jgi:hypothetical protein
MTTPPGPGRRAPARASAPAPIPAPAPTPATGPDDRGRSGVPRTFRTWLPVGSALSAALALAALAVGAQQPHDRGEHAPPGFARAGPRSADAAVQPAPTDLPAPADLRELAARSGCTLLPGTGNADYRQGSCTTPGGRIVLLTFTTESGQRQWKEEAESYGRYLIGPRWAVGGDPALLDRLHQRLGGTVEGAHHHAS